MATTAEQQLVVLPSSVMQAIDAIVKDDGQSLVKRAEAVLLLVHGYCLYAQTQTVDPTAVAIPEAQWTSISQALIDAGKGPVTAVNVALDWMNYGPSARKEGSDG